MPGKRSRDWAAYYSDSDEDSQVSVRASANERGAVSYSRYPIVTPKAQETDASSTTVDGEAELTDSNSSGSTRVLSPEVKRRKHGKAALIEVLLEHSDALRDAISTKGREDGMGGPCACKNASALAIYRCNECFSPAPLCRACIVETHSHTPLHWIEKWDGSQFIKDSLPNLGLVISLGHQSRRCTTAVYGPESGRLVTIVHTNGMHNIRIVSCCCSIPRVPDAIQFARAGLFPATVELPRTVFTFQVLKDFEAHSLGAMKSVPKYWAELQRLTSIASPATTPNRHLSFLPVVHVWRQLTSDRNKDIDKGMESDPARQVEVLIDEVVE